MSEVVTHAERMREVVRDAANGLVGRQRLVELVVLAAVAGEHVLIIGPPGTAKSAAVRRVSQRLGGGYFEYLLGRFTEPNEIFGPVDIAKLQEGRVETQTSGMLPEADIAFLDEVFLGSTAILNTLLSILNERRFRRGHTSVSCPLKVCVGASNAMPTDESLAAFADRFLINLFVEPTGDSDLEDLLEAGWGVENSKGAEGTAIGSVDALREALRTVDLTAARPWIAQAVRTLRGAGITLTDRRVVKVQRLVAAAALLDGRTAASPADVWPIVYAVPSQNGQEAAREVLREILEKTHNASLPHAAESASHGLRARATRILEHGHALLASRPEDLRGFSLRLEGVAREIDATFTEQNRPEEVTLLRQTIETRLSAVSHPEVGG